MKAVVARSRARDEIRGLRPSQGLLCELRWRRYHPYRGITVTKQNRCVNSCVAATIVALNPFIFVDETDCEIGHLDRVRCHTNCGTLHRVGTAVLTLT